MVFRLWIVVNKKFLFRPVKKIETANARRSTPKARKRTKVNWRCDATNGRAALSKNRPVVNNGHSQSWGFWFKC